MKMDAAREKNDTRTTMTDDVPRDDYAKIQSAVDGLVTNNDSYSRQASAIL